MSRPIKGTRMKKIFLNRHLYTMVDDEDYDWLSQYAWKCFFATKYLRYARYKIIDQKKGKTIFISMHRIIMKPPNGMDIDHVDGNGLNNQKINLRICTRAENCHNTRKRAIRTSKFKGVSLVPNGSSTIYKENMWKVQIQGKYIGCYKEEITAAKIYDEEAIKRFGEFARTNKSMRLY